MMLGKLSDERFGCDIMGDACLELPAWFGMAIWRPLALAGERWESEGRLGPAVPYSPPLACPAEPALPLLPAGRDAIG